VPSLSHPELPYNGLKKKVFRGVWASAQESAIGFVMNKIVNTEQNCRGFLKLARVGNRHPDRFGSGTFHAAAEQKPGCNEAEQLEV